MSDGSMIQRMIGAATLDVATYEEVEHDDTATLQAAGVVVLVAAAEVIGSIGVGTPGLFAAAAAALGGWLIWAGTTYIIGEKVFGGTATWGELLRTLGFAQAPGVLAVFAILPFVGWLLEAVIWMWLLVAGVVAIRQALDFSTGKAVATAILGAIAWGVLDVIF